MREKTEPGNQIIRKNVFLSLIISGVSYIYPILVFVYVARILTPEGLGRTSFALSVTAYFTLFTGLGMPIYGLRAVAEQKHNHHQLSRLTSELIIIRILSGILTWGVFLLVVHFLPDSNHGKTLLLIYGFTILISILDCTWLYKGMEDYSSLAAISAIIRIIGMISVFLLVRESSDIKIYAWISVLIPMAISVAELAVV